MKRFRKTKYTLEALAWSALAYVIGHVFASFVLKEIHIPFTFETESSRIFVLHAVIVGVGITMLRPKGNTP